MGTTVRKNRTHRRRGNVKSRRMTNNRNSVRQKKGGFIGLIFALGIITYGSLKMTKKIMKYYDKIEGQIKKEFKDDADAILEACKSIVEKTSIEGVETDTDMKKREIRMMYYILEAKDSGNMEAPEGKDEVKHLIEDLQKLNDKITIKDLKLEAIKEDFEPKPRYQRTLGKVKKSIMSKLSKLSSKSTTSPKDEKSEDKNPEDEKSEDEKPEDDSSSSSLDGDGDDGL